VAVDVREVVHQTSRSEHSPGNDGVTADELDAEAVVVVDASHSNDASGEDLAAVAADLFTSDGGQLRWRKPVATEVTVHVCGAGVARLAGVDDDHRATLASELERRGKPGG
jgi:hypothetical protein